MVMQKLQLPLLKYDISTRVLKAFERKINVASRKCLGVSSGLSYLALCCKKAKLVWPFRSVTEEFNVKQARLAMMLWESADENVRGFGQPVLKSRRVRSGIPAA